MENLKMDVLEREWVQVPRPDTVFIEAKVSDESLGGDIPSMQSIREALETRLSAVNFNIFLGQDIMIDESDALCALGPLFDDYKWFLQSLKIVEYVGEGAQDTAISLNNLDVKVRVYQLYDTEMHFQDDLQIPQAQITHLPHRRYDGQWENLVFENDIKGDLIWMMTNILRFAQKSEYDSSDMSPTILLYGPPGTGKTTLCQGLAQKISIRLNLTYKQTTLIQIKTAALLSKYYSESAKQVDQIFTAIIRMCQDDPEKFVCVLIDEVESIAFSREQGTRHGESQDSLRATNALLTGMDRAKGIPNIAFLCTSNMLDSLDSAFLDRCGLKIAVDLPTIPSQYAILRGRLQKLIDQGHVSTKEEVPTYAQAVMDRTYGSQTPGSEVLSILECIADRDSHSNSGRSLAQLPEQAILRYLRRDDCSLEMALKYMKQFVTQGQGSPATVSEPAGGRHKRKFDQALR